MRSNALSSIALGLSPAAVSPARATCSADPYADVIIDSTSTIGNPNRVFGSPNSQAVDFENDGNDPGFVTVGFNNDVVVNGPGDDFSVHLLDFPAIEQVGSCSGNLGTCSSDLTAGWPRSPPPGYGLQTNGRR